MEDFSKKNIEAAKRFFFKIETKDNREPHVKLEEDYKEEFEEVSNASNNSSARDIYEQRLRYKNLVNDLNYSRGLKKEAFDNRIDTWYKDESFFTKTTKHGRYLLPVFSKLKNINSPEFSPVPLPELPEIWVLDFVAAAFNNFMKDFFPYTDSEAGKIRNSRAKNSKGRSISSLGNYGKYLKAPHPRRGVPSKYHPFISYFKYLEDFYNGFVSYYKLRYPASSYGGLFKNNKVAYADYKRFEVELLNYVNEISEPITFDGFLKHKSSITYRSYLSFDVYEPEDPSSDKEKLDFLRDPKYPMYAYAAKKNGFKIDPNNPWRLYADIRTPQMQLLAFSSSPVFTDLKLSSIQEEYYQVKSNSNMIFLPSEMEPTYSSFAREVFFNGLGNVSTGSDIFSRFYDIYLTANPSPYSIVLGMFYYYAKSELGKDISRLELALYNKDSTSLYRDLKLSERGLANNAKIRERLDKFLKLQSIASKELEALAQNSEIDNIKRHMVEILSEDTSGLTGNLDPAIVVSLKYGVQNPPEGVLNDLYESKQPPVSDRLL